MKVDELSNYGIPEKYIQKIKEEKISELYPPQADIVRKNLLKDRNLIISLPTAGGKTLIATLSVINKLLHTKQKIVYIVPLVALGYEKYEYFKKFFDNDFKVVISVGDYDSSDPWLANYDIIIVTSEKLDSLLRHGANWVKDIGMIIVDEIHLLNDVERGPTLEILLTRLMQTVPQAQIFGLSATINNAKELAKWINATLLISDFRPVKLHEGICYNSKIQFYGKDSYQLDDSETDIENSILQNTLEMKKQCLYFMATRKNAETLAEKLHRTCKNYLSRNERIELVKLSEKILNVLEIPTQQCKKLAKLVTNGVAFHHAGLLGQQKRLLEENFRKGLIKTITSTPTLALGVNLPAFRVVIRDAKRYYSGIGSVYIPVLDYKQMTGRAGRPQYDSFGESILIAKSEDEAKEFAEHYILGEPEEIRSKLAVEPILRTQTLALIASDFIKSEKSLIEFFSKTFYAFQYGEISVVEEKLEEILFKLEEWNLIIRDDGKLRPTRIGKRISELYVDPLTAHVFIEALKYTKERKTIPLSYLQIISNTLEMRPLLSVKTGEISEIEEVVLEKSKNFLQEVPEEWDLEYEDFSKSIKTALLLESWINESTEDQILTKFNVAPGELRNKLAITDWLAYALHELALLLDYKESLKEIRKLRIRLKYGIKEELMPLVKLEQIGRVRARKLWNANLKSLEDLRKIPIESLAKIVGPNVATIIKNQLGEKVSLKTEKQTTLTNV